jgi:DNA-binding NtrC family response regulator
MKQALQVLVVDDEPQLREFVALALKEEGWEVSEAESAEHASELLREREWSVVISDVMLGGADGFSVLRQCNEELPDTKVVLMTGHGSATGALDATAGGAFDYFLKPFTIGDLHSLSRQATSANSKTP